MANIIPLKDNTGAQFYPQTHEKAVVDSNGVNLQTKLQSISAPSYVVAWDGDSTPVAANIPAGVTFTYGGNTYTGTLAASSSTLNKTYLVGDNNGNFDEYVTQVNGSTYSWQYLGNTEIDLSDYATKDELNQLSQEVTGLVDVLDFSPASQNLFDATTATNARMMKSGSALIVTDVQSYVIPVTPGQVVTVDQKTAGNRFAIYSTAEVPAAGVSVVQTVANNSANTLEITLGATEKYIVIYVDSNETPAVNVSNMRVYYGRTFVEEPSIKVPGPDWTEKQIENPPYKVFDSLVEPVSVGLVATNGGIDTTDNNYRRSDYISVKPSHAYRLTISGFICAYDSEKNVISGGGYSGNGSLVDVDYTTPSNCAFVILSARVSGNYEANAGYFKFYDLAPTYEIPSDFLHFKPLNGKRVVVFGDSIAGNYRAGWPLMMQESTGATVYNCGFGGCRMELLDGEDAGGTNPFAMCSLVDSIISGNWISQESSPLYSNSEYVRASLALLKTIDFSTVDIVVIAYGVNELGYPQDDPNDPDNKYTYAGATRYSLDTLMAAYKNLGVLLLTPTYGYGLGPGGTQDTDEYTHPTYGGKMTDNVATLKSVAQEYKVPCEDMYYGLSINKINRTAYYLDGTHFNYTGLKRYAGLVSSAIVRFQ